MNTQEVANRLVQLCREGKNFEAMTELYADNIVSNEPEGVPDGVTSGKAAVLEKSRQWHETVEEIHGGTVSDPVVSDDFFSCALNMDITFKGIGRMPLSEICVYKVKNGKIVYERFYYEIPEA